MASSLAGTHCDSSIDSSVSLTPLSSSGRHVYASDSSRNFSCSSSWTSDTTSGSSTRRSSCERSVSVKRNSKPHKAQDTAWRAIRGLQLREGNVGLNHFKILRQLGHGDIGSVHLAQLRDTSFVFAIKVMDKDALLQRNKIHRVHNEREVLELLDHPFLPTLYAQFETEQLSCLVMDFCSGGDLHSLRQGQRRRRFGVKAARFYSAEILVALEYLHIMGVIYRDLKPENVLLREDGHIMLTDFDLSLKCEVNPTLVRYPSTNSSVKRRAFRSLSMPSCMRSTSLPPTSSDRKISTYFPSSFARNRSTPTVDPQDVSYIPQLIAEPIHARSMSFVGTHEYLAPEIIAGYGHGNAVDWWTFGIFLYELLFGRTPFKGQNNDQTLMNILKQPVRFPEGAEIEIGHAAKSLIQGLLVKDPKKRLGSLQGVAEIKQQSFFQGINWALIRCAKPPETPHSQPISCQHLPGVPHRMNLDDGTRIGHKVCYEKGNTWIIDRQLVSDSLPDFEYF